MATEDWLAWIERWDRMQERYIEARAERFREMAGLVGALCPTPGDILDLGCGTGSVAACLLDAFPTARVSGVDLDPTLLPLARARTAPYGDRARFVEADLRGDAWLGRVPTAVDVVVSATALHWLGEGSLRRLYRQVATVLRPGGLFLNADHVGGGSPEVQRRWDDRRRTRLQAQFANGAEDWRAFWDAYLAALGPEARAARDAALGTWEGIEPGLPLAWHLDELRACGFRNVDAFCRWDGDALYGGVRGP